MERQIRNIALPILLILLLLMLLAWSSTAFCGDNYTLSISCVIPEIPGINSPLIQENTERNTYPAGGETNARIPQTEEKRELEQIIQNESEKEILLADGKDRSTVILQTLYSR
ncbi:MAG: hypothetical protein ABIA66_02425 [Candidatus Omnitrophota bacterium]